MEFRFVPAYDIPFPVAKHESAIERNAMPHYIVENLTGDVWGPFSARAERKSWPEQAPILLLEDYRERRIAPGGKPPMQVEARGERWDMAVRCAEPEKRVVYDYVVHNLVTGRTLRRGPATPEAIEKEGGELIPETRREVDESEVDGDGFVRRKKE
jgi:hypothetical protein